jgi:hypothetical protein
VPLANRHDEGEVRLREDRHLLRQCEKLVVVRDEPVPRTLPVQRQEHLPVVEPGELAGDLRERYELDLRHQDGKRSEDGRREVVIEGEADLFAPRGHHAARSAMARFAAS